MEPTGVLVDKGVSSSTDSLMSALNSNLVSVIVGVDQSTFQDGIKVVIRDVVEAPDRSRPD